MNIENAKKSVKTKFVKINADFMKTNFYFFWKLFQKLVKIYFECVLHSKIFLKAYIQNTYLYYLNRIEFQRTISTHQEDDSSTEKQTTSTYRIIFLGRYKAEI